LANSALLLQEQTKFIQMTALAVSAFQSKSKRNLCSDAPVAPDASPTNGVYFSSDLTGIEIEPMSEQSPKKFSGLKLLSSRSSSKSPKKGSPSKSPKSKSPKSRSSKSKSPRTSDGEGFFGKLFCAFGYGSLTGIYRPPPVAKGVYHDSRCTDIPPNSVKTLETTLDDSQPLNVSDWIASNLDGHLRGLPILIRRPEYDCYDEPDDKKLLKQILLKSRKLPQTPGKYANNHIMVNHERTKRNIPPLRRERHMDQIAKEHAELMAKEKQIFLIDNPQEVRVRIIKEDKESCELPIFERIGMNINRGKDIAECQRLMMAALAERNNIYDKRFFYMGMGTYTANDGVLYMCQMFGG